MKTKILGAAAGMLLAISCSYSRQQSAPVRKSNTMNNNVCVVELFTSEGCSSCPPADALMPELKKDYGSKLIVLSFHVDYWNRLGWKDVFSDAEWTQRQYRYATTLHSENVYTPQAVVNGTAHITGSNESGLRRLIEEGLKQGASRNIRLAATVNGQEITVKYDAALGAGEVLNIALAQQHAATNVRSGENGGRRLEHYSVVRALQTTRDKSGTINLKMPEKVSAGMYHVIAFVQRTSDMSIPDAGEIPLP